MVWKLDRLARSLRQLLDTVEALQARQMGLRSLTEAIDTGTPGGTLVFHLFGALVEFERQGYVPHKPCPSGTVSLSCVAQRVVWWCHARCARLWREARCTGRCFLLQ